MGIFLCSLFINIRILCFPKLDAETPKTEARSRQAQLRGHEVAGRLSTA